jgi:integrase
MGDWQQVGENLVRHKAGVIYLRAKVAGKIKRISLGTKDLRIAKLKRDDALAVLRKAAALPQAVEMRTLGDAVDALKAKVLAQADLEEATLRYYREIFKIMNESMDRDKSIRAWSHAEASVWWRSIAKKYAPQRANNVLGMVKRLGRLLVDSGSRMDNPVAELKRKKILELQVSAPSQETIDAIIESIRSQGKAHSDEAADFVAFLAYAGCRLGQARALCWKHVEADWVVFRSGVPGTKGAATRRLPISRRLKDVLERVRARRAGMSAPDDLVFSLKNPHEALTRACVRLELPHLRIHDLRHFFASWSLESGVDVRVVAQWLGHKDNGVLLLRRYAHVRDEHSIAMAEKLK